jgi:hypothetical protein
MCALPLKTLVSSGLSSTLRTFEPPAAEPKERDRQAGGRSEIVTVTVTKGDYRKLAGSRAPCADQVGKALREYLHAVMFEGYIQELERSHGWARGPVVSFKLPLPKDLVEKVRSLRGRFDGHTLEAVRLLMRGDADIVDLIPNQAPSSSDRSRGILSGALAAFLLVMSRIFGQPFFD